MHRIFIRIFCLSCLLYLCPAMFAADSSGWHWIKVGNNFDHAWDVCQGDAEVIIKDGQFSAKLFWKDSGKDVQISLKGSISNGRITAQETVYGTETDFSGSKFTGRLSIRKWKEVECGATGIETITLTDGLGMIGLTKTLKK